MARVSAVRGARARRQFSHAPAQVTVRARAQDAGDRKSGGHKRRRTSANLSTAVVASWIPSGRRTRSSGIGKACDMPRDSLTSVNGTSKSPVTSATRPAPATRDRTSSPRLITMALGIWLFLSPSVWTHSAQSGLNTRINGVIIVAASAWALRSLGGRYLLMTTACWLSVSTVSMWHLRAATVLNNSLVAVAVVALSFVRKRDERWQADRLRS